VMAPPGPAGALASGARPRISMGHAAALAACLLTAAALPGASLPEPVSCGPVGTAHPWQ